MPSPVEAKSLSSLTEIAGNPPRYPRNPAEQKREPLVLYLARVPGTQDIILTPLKPDLKNLKEIDVASSLYYLHRDLPSDIAEVDTEIRSPQEPQIARKPLPDLSAAAIAEKEKQALAALQALNVNRVSYLESNTPAETSLQPSLAASLHDPRPSIERDAPLARRPLGPRPLSTGQPPTLSRDASPYGKENVPIPPRPSTAIATDRARARANSLLSAPVAAAPATNSFSITVIRRDPNSGAQWNIGRISIASTTPAPPSTATEATITIHLSNPGYHQFTPTPLLGFTRQIRTEYSTFWEHAFKKHHHHHRRSSSTSSTQQPQPQLQHPHHTHHRSDSSSPPPEPQTYTTPSPWNGTLHFSTGASGRSLRCKHSLAAATADAPILVSELRYNLPAATDLFRAHAPAALASAHKLARHPKLAALFPRRDAESAPELGGGDYDSETPPPLPPRRSADDSSLSAAPPLPPRRSADDAARLSGSSEFAGEEDGRGSLDLSLGREKAGGGSRGGRAKMGKLIVYDEGVKMLDLVVAGNMGVWWEGWDR